MKIRTKQKGMSMGQIMLVLVLVGFVATMAISMVPVYIDNSTVRSAIQSAQEKYADADVYELTDNAIKGQMEKYFQVNMVDSVITEAVKIKRENKQVLLTINYEVRKPLMGNVDVVMKFNNEARLGR